MVSSAFRRCGRCGGDAMHYLGEIEVAEHRRPWRYGHQQPVHQGDRNDADDDPHGYQPTISVALKQSLISFLAFSGLSEPWTEFASIDSANSLRMVPAAALAGLVAPITLRYLVTASSPSSTWTTIAPEVMNLTRSL